MNEIKKRSLPHSFGHIIAEAEVPKGKKVWCVCRTGRSESLEQILKMRRIEGKVKVKLYEEVFTDMLSYIIHGAQDKVNK